MKTARGQVMNYMLLFFAVGILLIFIITTGSANLGTAFLPTLYKNQVPLLPPPQGGARTGVLCFGELSFSFGDDWPLYDPDRPNNPRGETDFQAALDNVLNLWISTGQKYPISLVVLDNELRATEMGNPEFNQQVYDNLTLFLGSINDAPHDLLFFDFHAGLMQNNPSLFSDHPLLDSVIIPVEWTAVEPSRGIFDFSSLENVINIWSDAGKSISLRIGTYGQSQGNIITPAWVYDTAPNITFMKGGNIVTVPKVWDPSFRGVYEEYVQALASQYDNDPRIDYIQIGVGHIGFTTAQPSENGSSAFLQEGWTTEIWEAYIKDVVDIYNQQFNKKALVVVITPFYLRDFPELESRKGVAEYAAKKGYKILFKGVDPNLVEFESTGIPEIFEYVSLLNYGFACNSDSDCRAGEFCDGGCCAVGTL